MAGAGQERSADDRRPRDAAGRPARHGAGDRKDAAERPLTSARQALFAIALSPLLCFAQTPASAEPDRLEVWAGYAIESRRDATVSPLRYDGTGPILGIEYQRVRRRFSAFAELAGAAASLSPSITIPDSPPNEAVLRAEIRVGAMRRMGSPRLGAGEFAFGPVIVGSLEVANHTYGDPDRVVYAFLLGAIAVGPGVSWQRSTGAYNVRVDLQTSLFGLIDHPYSDVRSTQSRAELRFAAVDRLRTLNGAVSLTIPANARVAMKWTYRFGIVGVDDLQPYRSATGGLSLGLVAGLGRSHS